MMVHLERATIWIKKKGYFIDEEAITMCKEWEIICITGKALLHH